MRKQDLDEVKVGVTVLLETHLRGVISEMIVASEMTGEVADVVISGVGTILIDGMTFLEMTEISAVMMLVDVEEAVGKEGFR